MKIEGLHEKELFEKRSPFRLIINQDLNFNYPAHWHNAIELIYVLENKFTVIVNSKKYTLNEKDIIFLEMIEGVEQSTQVTVEAVYLVHNNNIKLMCLGILHQLYELRTLAIALG